MRKLFDLQNNNGLVHFFALGILFTGIWANFFAIGDAAYIDPFHHGEYVASLSLVLAGNLNFFTIHGAMDWLPAWVAQKISVSGNHFFPTMLIYKSLDALASLFFYFIITLLIDKNNKYRTLILLISGLFAIYLVGSRDVFLLVSIWIYYLSDKSCSNKWRIVLELILGIALATNLLWSFDRGVASIVAIGVACLIMIAKEKRYLFSIVSFAISLFIFQWFGALSLLNYFANFQFLLATSSQWSYGFTRFPVILTLLVTIPNVWIIYYLIKQIQQNIQTNWQVVASLSSLLFLTILMYKIGVNRADHAHVIRALWMPALAFFYLNERLSVKWHISFNITIIISMLLLAISLHNPWFYLVVLIPLLHKIGGRFPKLSSDLVSTKLVIIVFVIPLLFANLLKISLQSASGGYGWLSEISTPPTNKSLVSESIRWVSSEISKAGSHCIFDLSNNGVINGITGLPACTKYIYPVYATQRYEAGMLKELQQHLPPVIVFYSTYWSFSIDGKSMHDRFPEMKNYLLRTYPYEKCNLGYCLRYLNQPS